MNYCRQRGASAFEFLTAVVLTVGLATLTLPNLEPLFRADRLAGFRTEFTQTLIFARNEAIRRKQPVLITANAPTFGNEYGKGWKTWADQNGNGAFDLGELLEIHGALPAHATLRAAGNKAGLVFDSDGKLQPAGAVQFSLCPVDVRDVGYLITARVDGLLEVTTNALCP
jgi:Tfp pilus assembly protein FimT